MGRPEGDSDAPTTTSAAPSTTATGPSPQGTLAIRAHVDTCDPRLAQVEALIEARDEMRPYIDLQLVAFPQDGYYRYEGGVELLRRAIDMGLDAVGGIPDFELTAGLGNESVRELAELAVDKGLLVDMHTDQTLDPQSRQIEALTWETKRLKLGSRASASHCTSLTTFHDNYAMKLIAQIADAGLNVIVSPMTSATCLKTMTRVSELWDAGVNIGFGQDCVMDPWYAFGMETCWTWPTWRSTSAACSASSARRRCSTASPMAGRTPSVWSATVWSRVAAPT